VTCDLHPKVEQDLKEAADHLAKHASPRTVARFFAEFERVANLLVENPGIGTPTSRGRRIHPFRVFRYSVVYRIVDSRPRILVVRHRRRSPSHGGGRR
jgi:plasmid stabilization system protein ParE